MTTIFSYKELKASYEQFKKALPKDMFERYAQELKHVRGLIQSAKLQGLEKDVFEYQKIEKESVEHLRAMGYRIQ